MNKKSMPKLRKPAAVFQKCPACQSKELIRLEVDVICSVCDWMSAEAYVASGGMDNIFAACIDHFNIDTIQAAAKLAEREEQSFAPINDQTVTAPQVLEIEDECA